MNDSLIERWKTVLDYYALLPDGRSAMLCLLIMDTIRALKPVECGEVKQLLHDLKYGSETAGSAICKRSYTAIERLVREKNHAEEMMKSLSDGSEVLEQRIKELTKIIDRFTHCPDCGVDGGEHDPSCRAFKENE